MNRILNLLAILSTTVAFSQTNPDVFIANIDSDEEKTTISGLTNLSNDPGYDNQPSFGTDHLLLFAGNNDGQTDIFQMHSRTGRKMLAGGSRAGGEYSPQLTPDGRGIAAVRLDTTGLQRLYIYDKMGDSTVLIPDLMVAYYTFFDANQIVGCYIEDESLNLFVHKLDEAKTYTLLKDVGRSFHKVPGQNSVSYTVTNEQDQQDVYLLDMETLESFFVTQLPIGVNDYAWLDDSRIVVGSKSSLFVYDTFDKKDWVKLADLDASVITDISRIAVNPSGNKIALVGIPK
ncbi:hypothetical protein BTO09_00850 [Gilvibacter sp. SZ-19]|uniref:TolB family protein n=1 Tax=unclassified Gilvibacter TaxID=2625242 RepID=UPI000B3C0535|nr:hypothetical protein [Gilvibacter sp. SZ-19]ARV10974.1 hypothetical protein BTO09_00850 [Gilvibacter sp. SZ-19]